MPNAVIDIPAAPASDAEAHFAASFRFETDCWDVHDALSRPNPPRKDCLLAKLLVVLRPSVTGQSSLQAVDRKVWHLRSFSAG